MAAGNYSTSEALRLLAQHFNETQDKRTEAARGLFAAMAAAFGPENKFRPHILIAKSAQTPPGLEGSFADAISIQAGRESQGPRAPDPATIVYSSETGFSLRRQRQDPRAIEMRFDAAQLKWEGHNRDAVAEIIAAWLE